jgi:AP2 domain/NUMOD4 motif
VEIEWRDVVGYEGLYRVSSDGQVFSLVSNRNLSVGVTRKGHLKADLVKCGIRRSYTVSQLMLLAFFPGSEGKLADHKDRNPKNNNLSNIRPATYSQNGANSQMSVYNVSGYRGVSWFKTRGKWRVTITVNCRKRHVGYFADVEEAAKAYNREALKHFGEFATLNNVS